MTNDATAESRHIWDSVSSGWDRHRGSIAETERPITEQMIGAIGVRDGDRILELTAGPGDIGLDLAARYPNASVLITDFAPGMVAIAARSARERSLANVEVREMDAQSIDLADASVDGVISRFGLMIVPDTRKAMKEILRVLKPGRSLAYAVWGPLPSNAWMMLFGAVLMQRGHFKPEPGDLFPLTTAEENRTALTEAGFGSVDVDVIDGTMPYESFDQYWNVSADVAGPVALIVKQLPAEEVAAVRRALEEFTAPFRTGEGLAFPAQRIFVHAS